MAKIPIEKFEKDDIEKYKYRLAKELQECGLTVDDFISNSTFKEYVSNYVNDNIIDPTKAARDRILGTTYKMSYLSIHADENEIKYPVINKYHGHNLKSTIYFKHKDKSIVATEMMLKDSPIIL